MFGTKGKRPGRSSVLLSEIDGEKLTTKNNETTSVRIPQFSPPLNRKEIQSNRASSTMTRKERDAERKRLQRANEIPEERAKRNEKKRLDAHRKRSLESSDGSSERLSKRGGRYPQKVGYCSNSSRNTSPPIKSSRNGFLNYIKVYHESHYQSRKQLQRNEIPTQLLHPNLPF
jgi:type IV secretory pathway VirB10-like protein